MLMALAVILLVAWILGFGVFEVASVALHVLLILAAIAVIAHFMSRGRGTLAPR